MVYPLFEITDKAEYTGQQTDSQQRIAKGEESLQVFMPSTLTAPGRRCTAKKLSVEGLFAEKNKSRRVQDKLYRPADFWRWRVDRKIEGQGSISRP
jgi:hypothetical protein